MRRQVLLRTTRSRPESLHHDPRRPQRPGAISSPGSAKPDSPESRLREPPLSVLRASSTRTPRTDDARQDLLRSRPQGRHATATPSNHRRCARERPGDEPPQDADRGAHDLRRQRNRQGSQQHLQDASRSPPMRNPAGHDRRRIISLGNNRNPRRASPHPSRTDSNTLQPNANRRLRRQRHSRPEKPPRPEESQKKSRAPRRKRRIRTAPHLRSPQSPRSNPHRNQISSDRNSRTPQLLRDPSDRSHSL